MNSLARGSSQLENRECERNRFQSLFDLAPAGMGFVAGPEHRWTYVNDHYVQLTGRSNSADFLGKTVGEAMPELAMQGFADLIDEVYKTGEPRAGHEVKVSVNRGKGGKPEEGYFDFCYQPVRDTAGKIEGVFIYAVEVTDKVAARQDAQRLAAIVESSEDSIISKDLRGIVTSWNAAAERMFGYTAEEMIGQSITKIIPPELYDDETRILQTIASGERIEHFETIRIRKNGEPIEISLTISPVRNESGKIVGAAKIARDITQQKQAERALHTTERLASVGRLAATVAHEINNPLEAVTNLIYLARNSQADGVAQYLTLAEEELERISHLTKQTLGFYRETNGATGVKLGEIVESLLTVFASRMRNRGIYARAEIRNDVEIQAIPSEIRQVLANLLGNSIDALEGRGGEIRVRISRAHQWTGNCPPGVRLTIADTGSGVPADIRTRLFEPFFTTKKNVGTGLGLWITSNIVENHKGSIRLRSSTKPSRSGTVFSIFLPIAAEALVSSTQHLRRAS